MLFHHQLTVLTLSLIAAYFVAIGVHRWTRSKGPLSIYSQDGGSLESVGLSFLSDLGGRAPRELQNGFVELRPTLGMRLGTPLVALVFMANVDFGPLLTSLGLHDSNLQLTIYTFTSLIFAYSWIMLMFFQRVIFDGDRIISLGIDLRRQDRDLSDLTDIRMHESRPALVLRFGKQAPLYLPKFLSHRDTFVTRMQAIIDDNLNNGVVPPMPKLRDRLGL
jgi:hypothetical protein